MIDNPVQPQVAWIAYDTKKRQLAAYYQLLIQRFYVRGQAVLAALSVNTLVDKSYRNFFWRDESGSLTSLFPTLANCSYDEAKVLGVSFIWIVPNEKSSEGFFQYLNFYEVQKLTLGIRPINSSAIIQNHITNPKIGRILGKLFELAKPVILPNIFFSKEMIFRQMNVKDLDDAVSLAREAYHSSNFHQIRDMEYLHWRYFSSPRKYCMYGLYNKQEELLAWCVTAVIEKGNSSLGMYTTCMITDMCCKENSKGLRFGRILLKHLINLLAKDENISLILVLYNSLSPYKLLFKKRNFIVLPNKYALRKFPLGVKVFKTDITKIVFDPRSWSVYFGDYDVV